MLWIILAIVAVLAAAFFAIAYYCYKTTFRTRPRPVLAPGQVDIPTGRSFEPFRQQLTQWALQTRQLPHEELEMTSFDGLKLHAKYYEYAPGAPVELMFHGYRSNGERDMSGGVQRCFLLGHSAVVVDQRGCGKSQGKTISFGILEHRDCLSWVELLSKRFGPNVKIILTGISMGAATVTMAAGRALPENVVGVIADCGFCSPQEIIRKVIVKKGYPEKAAYWMTRASARIYGGFGLESYSSVEALKTCKVPVIFFHGEKDQLVPAYMSQKMYEACASRKKLVTIPGAAHGLSYPMEPDRYLQELREFFGPELTKE